ncbi:MAG: translation initiation factor IF-2 subunit gamma [Promethearchaeota archaeon]
MMAKKSKTSKESEDLSSADLGITPAPARTTKKKSTAKKTTPKSKKSTAKKSATKKSTTKKTSTKKSTAKKTTKKKTSKKKSSKKEEFIQSSVNVGMVGHVDHGKTTLVKSLSGTWTERYSDEQNRGITIKLGYAETKVMECPNCGLITSENLANKERKSKKDPKGMCPNCQTALDFRRRISFVDAPGHEILMATMLSGASLMDGAVLLVAANEKCPQPQTREHLAALEIAKIDNIIIIQNKIDAVGKKGTLEHYDQIKEFVKGTIAEKAPIIPVSAIFDANVDKVVEAIEKYIPSPDLDDESDFLFNVARSFDVNRPGTEIQDLKGGVVGGSIISGVVEVGDEIEIRPGIKDTESGKYLPVITKIQSIYEGPHSLDSARPGGLIAFGTSLDPANTRTDQLIGSVIGAVGTLPDVQMTVQIEVHLLDTVLGAEEEIKVLPVKMNELLMIVVGTSLSAGTVSKIGKKNVVTLKLKRPICGIDGSIAAISRRINNRFRLIGYGYLVN